MYTAQLPGKGAFSIRYPRGNGMLLDWKTPFEEIPVGTGKIIHNGKDLAVLTIGPVGNKIEELQARWKAENISVAHYDMRFVKPLDEKLLHEIFRNFTKIITVEDGVVKGGFGSAVLEFMSENGYSAQIIRLGIPDKFIEHGTQEELYTICGYDKESIYKTVKALIS
jgi:1-deoxy-D-xylulose-5-phosphate synthase